MSGRKRTKTQSNKVQVAADEYSSLRFPRLRLIVAVGLVLRHSWRKRPSTAVKRDANVRQIRRRAPQRQRRLGIKRQQDI